MSELRGKRALVTGASSGIGAALAVLLAEAGVDLVLTARRKAALDAVAVRCTGARADTRIDVIVADLGTPSSASNVWNAATAGGPIDILVNNAGFGYFRPFAEVDWVRDAELLQLNITSLVELARRFVDARAGEPGRGYVLNIASIGAYQSVPQMSLYAASKAFVRNFSEGLHDELRGTPISVTCVCPGGTKTEFHAIAGAGDYSWIANASMKSAEEVARFSLRALIRGKRTAIPGVINKLSCFGVRLVPRRFASWMAGRVLGKPKKSLPPRSGAPA